MRIPPLRLVSAILGAVGGLGTIGAMWLPLAKLAGLGPVGPFDYSHGRVYGCIGAASLVVIASLLGAYRTVLLFTGVLCGLLAATGIDLHQALHELMSASEGETSQMARQMVANSSLQAGAYLLPVCCLACIAAAILGGRRAGAARSTNES